MLKQIFLAPLQGGEVKVRGEFFLCFLRGGGFDCRFEVAGYKDGKVRNYEIQNRVKGI